MPLPRFIRYAPKILCGFAALWFVVATAVSAMVYQFNVDSGAFGTESFFQYGFWTEAVSNLLRAVQLIGIALIVQLLIMILQKMATDGGVMMEAAE